MCMAGFLSSPAHFGVAPLLISNPYFIRKGETPPTDIDVEVGVNVPHLLHPEMLRCFVPARL